MKKLFAVLLTFTAAQSLYAGQCETYEDLVFGKEVAAGDIKPMGHAIMNRANGDKIYLGCAVLENGECTRLTTVLEAVSCASKDKPRFFNINTKIDFQTVPEGRAALRMHYATRSELGFPRDGYEYVKATYIVLYAAGETSVPVFYVALPFAIAIDVALLPYRIVKTGIDKIAYKVVMSKANRALVVNEEGVDKRAMRMKRKHFENLLHAFSRISEGL